MNAKEQTNENHIIHFHRATEARLVCNFPGHVCVHSICLFLCTLLNEVVRKIMHKLLHLTSLIESIDALKGMNAGWYHSSTKRNATHHNLVQ